jgi:hypothetical protein
LLMPFPYGFRYNVVFRALAGPHNNFVVHLRLMDLIMGYHGVPNALITLGCLRHVCAPSRPTLTSLILSSSMSPATSSTAPCRHRSPEGRPMALVGQGYVVPRAPLSLCANSPPSPLPPSVRPLLRIARAASSQPPQMPPSLLVPPWSSWSCWL